MALRLRKVTETFRLELGAALGEAATVLVGKFLNHGELLALRTKATKRGVVDDALLDSLFFEAALVGWENILNESGAPVPFTAARAAEVARALPDDVVLLFVRRVKEPAWSFREAEGNSFGSSPAAPTVTTPSNDSGAESK